MVLARALQCLAEHALTGAERISESAPPTGRMDAEKPAGWCWNKRSDAMEYASIPPHAQFATLSPTGC